MYHISEECVACGSCLPVCPVKAIKEGEPYVITTKCTDCGKCAEICPVEAISPGTPGRR
ncbi:MAG: Ferredoxin [Candidatus Ozemobacter sibiricus]|jgi:NAD-dependent dihydropyrimidine dehydrogenase PreA subunit|uniref:Ferredoxin n=1 Tax=Candidatus Ozemobacter sibiricus TaxID=2268124 RepID=A0A367ZQL9_9BACT|nr:MAG: Ferredoxin [Candidatus Ozemobacter sibiricus]